MYNDDLNTIRPDHHSLYIILCIHILQMYTCTPVWESEENIGYDRVHWSYRRGSEDYHSSTVWECIRKHFLLHSKIWPSVRVPWSSAFCPCGIQDLLNNFTIKLFMSNWVCVVWFVFSYTQVTQNVMQHRKTKKTLSSATSTTDS